MQVGALCAGWFEPVGKAFLKHLAVVGLWVSVTVYVAQVGSLAMMVICNGLQTVSRRLTNRGHF